MEALLKLYATIRPSPFPAKTPATNRKRRQSRALSCLRPESQDHSDTVKNILKSSDVGPVPNNNIWKLFSDAQKNIIDLNKQRLIASEELKRVKAENQLLLDKIKELEAERPGNHVKDKASVCWEWLLRVDSMVLKNMITIEEATEMRTLVMNSKIGIAGVVTDVTGCTDQEILSSLRNLYAMRKKDVLHVIHICTEMEPLVIVGSMASYVTGVSRSLQNKGNLAEVILPKYTGMGLSEVQGLRETEANFYSFFDGQYHQNKIWTGIVRDIGVTFIEPVSYSSYFDREAVYGCADDFERFSYFSRASLDYIVKSGKHPDILHIHNWEAAIVAPLFWDIFVNQGLQHTRIMLTCHTFDSELCHVQPEKLALCGLDPSRLNRSDRLQHNTKLHLVDVLKGGVVFSNKVAVTSSFYRKAKSSGSGFESTLSIHKDKLFIAPSGFVDSLWNPSKDEFLPETYAADDMEGKAVCKLTLQQQLGFSECVSTPTIGCFFSDLPDYDIEGLQDSIWIATKRGCQLIIMHDNKASRVDQNLERLTEYKDPNLRFVKYDEASFHLVLAGSDIVLCSSDEDTVFQVPLKAMKYGAAPIAMALSASRTRNLEDSEFGGDDFSQYIPTTFANMSLKQALDELEQNPSHWNSMIMDAMRKDFSWDGECCDLHISAYMSLKNL